MENQTSNNASGRGLGRDPSGSPAQDTAGRGDGQYHGDGQAGDMAGPSARHADAREGDAADALDDKARQLAAAYRRFAETGRDYVRTSPATAVLVALVAGYSLSMLFRSRKS